jgi:preprotein translocase subunit SecG
MQAVIIVIHLMLVLAMIGLVLLQKSEGGGLGIGSTGGFMSSRGTTNALTRTTAILAASFFATSLLLSVMAGIHRNPGSILKTGGGTTPPGPTSPVAPASPTSKSGDVLDQLKKMGKQPSGPEAPQSK